MTKTKRKKSNHKGLKVAGVVALLGGIIAYFFLFSSMSKTGEKEYVFIDNDDNIDSVYTKLEHVSTKHSLWTFKQLAKVLAYKSISVQDDMLWEVRAHYRHSETSATVVKPCNADD